MRDALNETTKRIVEESDPDKIILFGSRAKKRIPESSSLIADILLKRIEAEKSKFEELYADLDILEKRNLLNKRWKILNSNF